MMLFQKHHIRDEENLSILESLGLIRYVIVSFPLRVQYREQVQAEVHYHHLTLLGVEFCEVCSKPRVQDLEKVSEASRKKNLKHRDLLFDIVR